jgi:acyl-CoA reductase-like NAD-dependent aldehyde dehydrogenase
MESLKMLPYINPAQGEQFGHVVMTTPAEVMQARNDMRESFKIWQQKPVEERVWILRQFQRVMIDSLDEISDVLTQDTGKSRQDAVIEAFMTVNLLDEYCKHAPHWLKRRRVSRGLYLFKWCYVEPHPYGVVAVIAPWNYPLNLAMSPLLAALMAGNTVLLKPSEVTAATGKLMENLFARVPELSPFVRVIHGDGSVGAALVHSAPDYIFFTGSAPTGRAISHAAAEQLIPMSLELGGKDAMIVLEDADLAKAARWGAWGSCFNAGQSCVAVERVYVVEQVYDEFVDHAAQELQKLRIGYTRDRISPFYVGPISDPRQVAIIKRHLDDALARGARVLVGGTIDGMFVEPTMLVDVDHSMQVMHEETFGPLMPIMKVKDEAEAIRLANDSSYGLGASIWSADLERAQRVAHQIEASSIIINDTVAQFAIPMLPFGGVKQSGYGRIHGKEGLMQFTRPYAYMLGQPPLDWDVATVLRKPGYYHAATAITRLAFGVTLRQRLQGVRDVFKLLNKAPDQPHQAVNLGVAGAVGVVGALLIAWKRQSGQKR